MLMPELREPAWLLLALLPGLFFIISRFFTSHNQDGYSDHSLLDWVLIRQRDKSVHLLIQLLFVQLAWILIAIAIAGPRSQLQIAEQHEEQFREVIAIVDASLSMSARDVLPGRIERAKLELLDLIEQMQQTRLAIIIHSARAHLLSPLTSDKHVLRHYVSTINTHQLPTEGSRPFEAFSFAVQFFSEGKNPRSIIYISDGEHHLTAGQEKLAFSQLTNLLKQHSTSLYTLGIGRQSGAPLITSTQNWLHQKDQAILSRLNAGFLARLANQGHGVYTQATDDNQDWQTIYHKGIAQYSAPVSSTQQQDIIWQENYHAYALSGFILLLIGGLTKPVIRKRGQKQILDQKIQILFVLSAFIFSLQLFDNTAHAATPSFTADQTSQYQNALQLYQSGKLHAAKNQLAKLPGFDARYAEGVIYYQTEDYQRATLLFIQASLDAYTDQQRRDAIFNLANCYYKLERYNQARRLYNNVLNYAPNYQPAIINRQYAELLARRQAELNKTTTPQSSRQNPRGNSLAEVEPGTEITGRVGLSESDTREPVTIDPLRPVRPQQAGPLAGSSLASEDIQQQKDPEWTYEINTLIELKAQLKPITVNEGVIWQRLYEVEQGFDAPQSEANIIEGIKPW